MKYHTAFRQSASYVIDQYYSPKRVEGRCFGSRKLETLSTRVSRVEGLEKDRDGLLEHLARLVPDGLDGLTGEVRNRVYRMLRLQVVPTSEG